MLMAADARRFLAGLDVGRRAHRLVGEAVLVERLEEDRFVRRHDEPRGAVGFHRHGAEDGARVLLARDADARRVDDIRCLREDLDDAQFLDRAARHVAESLVDVGDEHLARRRLGSQRAWQRTRHRLRPERHRAGAADLRIAVEQLAVAGGVEQAEAERVVGVGIARVLALEPQPLRAVGRRGNISPRAATAIRSIRQSCPVRPPDTVPA